MPRSNNPAGDGAQAEGFGMYEFAVTDAEQVIARDDPPMDDRNTVNEKGINDQDAVTEQSSTVSGAVGDVVTDSSGVTAASQLIDVLAGNDQAAAAGSPDFDNREVMNDAQIARFNEAFGEATDQRTQQDIVQNLMTDVEPPSISIIARQSAEGWGSAEDSAAADGKTAGAEALAGFGAQVKEIGELNDQFSKNFMDPLSRAAESNLARVGA